ncbi:GAF domain-containing protein [Mesorhizobium sp. VNQ89]|uniref:GAF domain-containing protein n=1 Tax=Mesorhizobium quangtriensis TaxID=3157709 RepID=UPI0032B7178E
MGSLSTAGHADRIFNALQSNDAARSALVASWKRSCDLHRLEPTDRSPPQRLTDSEFKSVREGMEPLITAAQASLDRLYQAVGGVGCCVLLADRNGVPIERRGSVGDDRTFRDWGLWTGTIWSEDSEGTNGIGTCLVEQRALTIHRDQHFFSRNTLLSCTTAPIYDHRGNIAGALDVSSCRADLTEGFVNLIAVAVGDAARRIEAENFRLAFPHARILLAPTEERLAGALIAVDRDDLVIGATRAARQALGLTDESFTRPLLASDLVVTGDGPNQDTFADAERAVLQRALIHADGNVSAAAQALGISRATLHRKLTRFGISRPP